VVGEGGVGAGGMEVGREGGRGRKGVYRWMCDRGMGWGNAVVAVVAVENDGGEGWRAKRVWDLQPYGNGL